MTIEKGDPVAFTKFDGGIMVGCSGILESVEPQFVKVEFEGAVYSFKRQPGPKCGWGTGPAKNWRLNMNERSALCERDLSHLK